MLARNNGNENPIWSWNDSTINRTYQIDYDIRSSQITTGMVIWYLYNKIIYTHTYPSTYEIRVQMIITNHVLVHIRDRNDELICLQYVSHYLRQICHIRNDNICGCKVDTINNLIKNVHSCIYHHYFYLIYGTREHFWWDYLWYLPCIHIYIVIPYMTYLP